MDFSQSSSFSSRINTPEAYERLITACIRGERSGSLNGIKSKLVGNILND